MWWIWGLAGLVLFGVVAGVLNDLLGFKIGFLLGSLMFGLSSLMIALSPTPTAPATSTAHTPPPSAHLQQQQQQEENHSKLVPPEAPAGFTSEHHLQQPRPRPRVSVKDALSIISSSRAVGILMTVLLLGMASGVVPTALHWYFVMLNASRSTLGASLSAALICTPLVFPLNEWLWKRCGTHYIFIIGLLFYSIRFLGYSLVEIPVFLVVIETLEPMCSIWMLLTASGRIQRHLAATDRKRPAVSDRSLQVNSWALVIIFHYCFGRGIGGSLAAMLGHHFGVVDVFIASAMISLTCAAIWFLCVHLVTNCSAKRARTSKKKDELSPSKVGKSSPQPRTNSYTQLQDLKPTSTMA